MTTSDADDGYDISAAEWAELQEAPAFQAAVDWWELAVPVMAPFSRRARKARRGCRRLWQNMVECMLFHYWAYVQEHAECEGMFMRINRRLQ